MYTKTMIRQLQNEAERHKNDKLLTFQTDITAMCNDIIPKLEQLKHYEDLAEQGRLVDIETYQQRLIRYIDAGKYRSADKKVFSENDVVYLIEHGIFPCKSEAEQAFAERNGIENIKNT